MLLGGIAEAAPYLWDLVQVGPARALSRLLDSDPDAALADLLAETVKAAAATRVRRATCMRVLRRMKAEAALLIALADIGGVWPVARVTAALTDVADTALGAAVHFLLARGGQAQKARAAGSQQSRNRQSAISCWRWARWAAASSISPAISISWFSSIAAAAKLAAGVEPAPFYVNLTRDLVKLLQERTADGYVFRVDLRLRPDPSSTQIAISTEAALDYYESRGQNWERAALIKARACAGDLAAGERLLARSRARSSGGNISTTRPLPTFTK